MAHRYRSCAGGCQSSAGVRRAEGVRFSRPEEEGRRQDLRLGQSHVSPSWIRSTTT